MRRFLESVSLALKLLEASRTLRYEGTTGEIWRDRGRGKALHTRCGDRRRQSAKTQKRTFKGISGKVWPHAAFGRGRNSVGRQAAPHRNGRPWRASGNGRNLSGGETAQYRGHCSAHSGSLSAARGSQEGSGARHPALHLLTGLKVSSRVGEQSGLLTHIVTTENASSCTQMKANLRRRFMPTVSKNQKLLRVLPDGECSSERHTKI